MEKIMLGLEILPKTRKDEFSRHFKADFHEKSAALKLLLEKL